jgi:hypothetical protein
VVEKILNVNILNAHTKILSKTCCCTPGLTRVFLGHIRAYILCILIDETRLFVTMILGKWPGRDFLV